MIHIGLAAVLLVVPPIDQASVRDAALSAGFQEAYVGAAGPIALRIHAAYDIPASVTVAQSILESNWGRSKLSTAERNYFGFKCVTPTSPGPLALRCARYPTTECIPAPCHPVDAFFRSYASVDDSFRDYGRLVDDFVELRGGVAGCGPIRTRSSGRWRGSTPPTRSTRTR